MDDANCIHQESNRVHSQVHIPTLIKFRFIFRRASKLLKIDMIRLLIQIQHYYTQLDNHFYIRKASTMKFVLISLLSAIALVSQTESLRVADLDSNCRPSSKM